MVEMHFSIREVHVRQLVSSRQCGHVTAQPINVGNVGSDDFLLAAQHVTWMFDGDGQVHNQPDFGRAGWAEVVQESISINDPAFQ